jgi:cystathionine beta-lyase
MTPTYPSLDALRARASIKWRFYPEEVIPCWIADMDFDIAPPIKAAMDALIARGELGYPQAYAQAGLDEIFCRRLAARYEWQVNPGQVQFFSDVVQTIYLALLTLSEPGDGVLFQTPIYPPFFSAVAETGRRADTCALRWTDAGYRIDFETLERSIDARTRILLLCHPHNPTGRAFTREELEGLAALVLRHDLRVISDEIHADLMLTPRAHIPFASLSPEIAARTLTLTSPSKPFNIAGLCLAVGIFGSSALAQAFAKLPEHVRGGRSALGMAAARAAWTEGDAWLEGTLALLRRNRDRIVEFVATRWPGVRHVAPEATYLAWLDFRALGLDMEPQKFFLTQAKVGLSEGPAFGEEGKGWVRLNFATSPEVLEEILQRMDRALAAR